MIKPVEERFWSRVIVKGPDDCWVWTAAKDSHGYGQIVLKNKRKVPAHRLSWAMANNVDVLTLHRDQDVCHTCDNPPCVNPKHLFLGTAVDNMQDCRNKKRNYCPPPNTFNAKIDREAADRIREIAARGVSYEWIAKAFGLCAPQIGRIVRHESWVKV